MGTSTKQGEFSFTVDLTPVDQTLTPGPGSIVLLGSGLLGLVGVRRQNHLR